MSTIGYYKAGKRYLPAVLIGGPYDWKDAVRLKLLDSEIITTRDKFVTDKPVSEFQHIRNETRAKRAAERAKCVASILHALADGELHTNVEIADVAGVSPQAVYGRICNWPEFRDVSLSNSLYQLTKHEK